MFQPQTSFDLGNCVLPFESSFIACDILAPPCVYSDTQDFNISNYGKYNDKSSSHTQLPMGMNNTISKYVINNISCNSSDVTIKSTNHNDKTRTHPHLNVSFDESNTGYINSHYYEINDIHNANSVINCNPSPLPLQSNKDCTSNLFFDTCDARTNLKSIETSGHLSSCLNFVTSR